LTRRRGLFKKQRKESLEKRVLPFGKELAREEEGRSIIGGGGGSFTGRGEAS